MRDFFLLPPSIGSNLKYGRGRRKARLAWIFILEGLITVVAGFMSFWIIQDFPDTAKFLTEAERTVVVRRLQSDDQYSAAGENLRWHYIWASLLDWKTWVGSESLV